MGTPKDSEKTRSKIIDAAGQLFAERGLKGVTVRDIAKKAETHLGALNYHFRSKEALYREVLLEACRKASISSEDQQQLFRLEPRVALYVLIDESLKLYREQTDSNWEYTLITRESREPSSVFEEVVEVYLKPQTEFIAGIMGRAVGRSADDHEIRFAVMSLIGLLDTFGQYGHWIDAVAPGLLDHLEQDNLLTKHILHMVREAACIRSPESEEGDSQ